MITAFVLKIVLFAMALVLVVLLVRSLFMRSSGAKSRPESLRIRLRGSWIVVVAIGLLALGLLSGMLGFGSGDMRDPVPFRIASVALVVGGLLVLLLHRRRGRSR